MDNNTQEKPSNKSKISQSLMHTIKKADGAGRDDIDVAFSEADEKRVEPSISDSVEVDSSQEDEAFSEEKQFKIDGGEGFAKSIDLPKRIKPKKNNRKMPRLGVFSLVLAILALGGTAFTYYNFHFDSKFAGTEFILLHEMVGNLVNRADTQDGQLSETNDRVLTNQEAIAAINDLKQSLTAINNSIGELSETTTEMKSLIDKNSESIESTNKTIEQINGDIELLKTYKKTATSVPTKRQPKTAVKNYGSTTFVAGAKLASIDDWGAVPNAVLRDGYGSWIPLSLGDYYQGWKFIAATDVQATFSKGKKIVKVVVEE